MRLVLSYLIFFIFAFSSSAQTFYVKVKDKYAFCRDQFPNFITEPIYYYVSPVGKNFVVQSASGYMLLDSMAKPVLDTKQKYSHYVVQDSLNKDYYSFLPGTKDQLLIDPLGKIIAKLPNVRVKEKWGDLFWIELFLSDSINKPYFKEGDQFDKSGIMSIDGKWLIEPGEVRFEFTSRNCFIMYDNRPGVKRKISVLNHKAQLIVDEEVTIVRNRELGDSMFRLRQTAVFNDIMAWLIDSTGKVIEKKERTLRVKDFNEKGKWGLKHHRGVVVEAKYNKIDVLDNYFAAYSEQKKTDLYDKKGVLVTTLDYEKIYSSHHEQNEAHHPEFLIGEKNNGLYILNDKFEPVSQPVEALETKALCSSNNAAWFICEKKDKYGVLDNTGKVIVPFIYNRKPSYHYGAIRIELKTDRYDFYTTAGKLIVKNAASAQASNVNPNLYIISMNGGSYTAYTIDPLKALFPKKQYRNIYESGEVFIARNKDEVFVLNKNFESITNRPLVNATFLLGDHTTLLVHYKDNDKKQLVNNSFQKISEEYTHMEKFDIIEKIFTVGNKDANGKFNLGVIDPKGKTILNMEWDHIEQLNKYYVLHKDRAIFFADSNFVVNRDLECDSIYQPLYQDMITYRSKGKWYVLGHSQPAFDNIKRCDIRSKLEAQFNGKWGVYDLAQRKWIIQPQFDSVVHIFQDYSPDRFFYTTKINKWTYLVDPAKSIIKGDGYTHIDNLYFYSEAPYRFIPDLLANKGGSASTHLQHNLIGGKYSIIDVNGKKKNTIDADHVEPLLYDDEWTPRKVFGMLWNVGGVSKEYISQAPDSIQVLEVDHDAGNEYYVNKLSAPVYSRRIIGGKFGILSIHGKEILPPIYDDIKFYVEYSREPMYKRFGFSDSLRYGNEIIIQADPIYIKKDGLWGIADLNGKILLPVQYDSLEPGHLFDDVLRAWSRGKFGYFDVTGKPILPVEFSGEQEYSLEHGGEQCFLFQKNGIATTYTLAGDSVEQELYDERGDWYVARVATLHSQQNFNGGTYGFYYPKTNTWLFEPVYEDIVCSQEYSYKFYTASVTGSTALYQTYGLDQHRPFELKKAGKWGLGNRDGKVVVPCMYDSIGETISEQLIKFWLGGKFGCYDAEGKQHLTVEFSNEALYTVSGTKEDMFMLFQRDGTVSEYTVTGDSVDESSYDESGYEIMTKKLPVYDQKQFSGGKYGFYDLKTNAWALEPLYDDIIASIEFFVPDSGRKYLRRSVLGKYKEPCNYVIEENSFYQIKKDGKWGIFQFKKGILLKPEFDEIVIEKDGFRTRLAGAEKLFTLEGKSK